MNVFTRKKTATMIHWKIHTQTVIFDSWWVLLTCLLCYIGLEQAQKSVHAHQQTLSDRLRELMTEKKKAAELQKKLKMEINSQSDPAWVELTLMKGLGLVPEGQKKVYFLKDPLQ